MAQLVPRGRRRRFEAFGDRGELFERGAERVGRDGRRGGGERGGRLWGSGESEGRRACAEPDDGSGEERLIRGRIEKPIHPFSEENVKLKHRLLFFLHDFPPSPFLIRL